MASFFSDLGYAVQDRVDEETDEGGMLSRAEEGDSPSARRESPRTLGRPRIGRQASSRTAVDLKLPNEVLNAKVAGVGVARIIFERTDEKDYDGDPFKTRCVLCQEVNQPIIQGRLRNEPCLYIPGC